MQYKGHELKEITEPQIFDPPKKMLVWNRTMDYAITSLVVAIVERMDGICSICYDGEIYPYCAEIPEEPKPRRATWKELAFWLIGGNGLVIDKDLDRVDTGVFFDKNNIYEEVGERWLVMGKDDTEWHEPTVDYMGLEG